MPSALTISSAPVMFDNSLPSRKPTTRNITCLRPLPGSRCRKRRKKSQPSPMNRREKDPVNVLLPLHRTIEEIGNKLPGEANSRKRKSLLKRKFKNKFGPLSPNLAADRKNSPGQNTARKKGKPFHRLQKRRYYKNNKPLKHYALLNSSLPMTLHRS